MLEIYDKLIYRAYLLIGNILHKATLSLSILLNRDVIERWLQAEVKKEYRQILESTNPAYSLQRNSVAILKIIPTNSQNSRRQPRYDGNVRTRGKNYFDRVVGAFKSRINYGVRATVLQSVSRTEFVK